MKSISGRVDVNNTTVKKAVDSRRPGKSYGASEYKIKFKLIIL